MLLLLLLLSMPPVNERARHMLSLLFSLLQSRTISVAASAAAGAVVVVVVAAVVAAAVADAVFFAAVVFAAVANYPLRFLSLLWLLCNFQGWRFNVVMVLISMFYAMMLTNWGDINTDGESSNPKNGWTAMWLTTTGQWVCYIIYGWTLVAPRIFPDRDFS